ncbi:MULTISPECIES: YybS family protein [Paraliobacillus]|uniref:YybS family protein n=1 Tax=Paraliobacillus TaxID=200903 RepID=UPI000DD39432|nr:MULTISPECIES: DUF2232 domain-containing protein [Paraliobacillus]
MYDSKKVQEGVLLSTIYGLLLLVTILVPAIELVTVFLLPIPFVIYASHHGYKASLILGGFVTVLALLLIFVISFPLTIMSVLGGTMIGEAIYKKRNAYETWAFGTVGVTIGLLVLFLMIQLVLQINIVDEYQGMVQESITSTESLVTSLGIELSSDEIALIKEEMLKITTLLPSILVICALGIAFVTQWVSYKILNWRENRKLRFPPFKFFLLPKTVVWIYFFAILFTWFELDPTSSLAVSVVNVTNLVGLLLTLQGLSFVLFYSYKKKLASAIPILIIVGSIIILPAGLYMLRILGIIDIGFGLRERFENKK